MLASEDRAGAVRSVWSQTLFEQLRLTEDGLVLGAGSILVRLGKGTDAGRAAIEANADRIVALMSVAAGRPLTPDAVVPHVAAAAEYWRRDKKALAHLRLAVARLPHLACAADAWRVAIAGHLLDAGMPPAALVTELWPDAGGDLAKNYDPDEPRDWRGRWTNGAGSSPEVQVVPHPIQVAANSGPPDEDQKHFREEERTGIATAGQEATHGRPIDITGALGGAGRLSATEAAATTVMIPLSRFGEAAQHVIDAQEAGHPDTVTIARENATANRAAATGKLPKVPGMHLDEYPPAMFKEGGSGASVRAINPSANRILGAYIGRQFSGLPSGARVKLQVHK